MKKTLLMAAATLAAGIISTQATGVYSQNIVGYVNVVYTNGVNNLIANPLVNGTNNGSQVFGTNLPDGTQIFQWNGVSGFNGYAYDAGLAVQLGVSSPWFNGDETATSDAPVFVPGSGFFLLPTATFTNTYVGTVIANTGSSVTNSFVNGAQTLVASQIPFAGSLTNASFNYTPPDGTQIFFWNGSSGFNGYAYDAGLAVQLGLSSPWFNGDETAPSTAPVVNVGQGFFVLTTASWNWVESF